jgi:hypothetical protein
MKPVYTHSTTEDFMELFEARPDCLWLMLSNMNTALDEVIVLLRSKIQKNLLRSLDKKTLV